MISEGTARDKHVVAPSMLSVTPHETLSPRVRNLTPAKSALWTTRQALAADQSTSALPYPILEVE